MRSFTLAGFVKATPSLSLRRHKMDIHRWLWRGAKNAAQKAPQNIWTTLSSRQLMPGTALGCCGHFEKNTNKLLLFLKIFEMQPKKNAEVVKLTAPAFSIAKFH
jgi:hypothetical protein